MSFSSCLVLLGRALSTSTPKEVGVEINGVRWATRNVDRPGTFVHASHSETSGWFYQWNRRIGWSPIQGTTTNSAGETVWNRLRPTGHTWDAENDPCPEGWRLPTREEFQSLVNTGSVWTTVNRTNGRLFGTYPNQIFLPASGVRRHDNGERIRVNANGQYLTSTLADHLDMSVWGLFFGDDFAEMQGVFGQAGSSIRCVAIE